jgi:uncharacterized membrane protein
VASASSFLQRPRTWFEKLVDRPHLCVGALALVFGLGFAILTPAFKGSDEGDHFARAYQLSRFQIATIKHGPNYGASLPSTLRSEIDRVTISFQKNPDKTAYLDLLDRPHPHGPDRFYDQNNAASYAPVSYVPAAIGIGIGNLFGASTLAMLYLGRFGMAVVFAALVAFAVRRTPVRPWLIGGTALIPLALLQGSTINADGMTMALSFVVLALGLRMALTSSAEEITRRDLVEAGVAIVALGLCKPPYVLLGALYLVPAFRYRSRVAKWLGGLLAAGVVAEAAWSIYAAAHSRVQDIPDRWIDRSGYAFKNIHAGEQLHFVLTHPWSFAAVVARTTWDHIQRPLDLFGPRFLFPTAILIVAVLIFGAAALSPLRAADPQLPRSLRIVLLIMSAVVVLGVMGIEYTNVNALRAPRIDALNHRYWLPLVPWALMAILPNRFRWGDDRLRRYRAALVIVSFVFLAVVMVGYSHRVYGPNTPFVL